MKLFTCSIAHVAGCVRKQKQKHAFTNASGSFSPQHRQYISISNDGGRAGSIGNNIRGRGCFGGGKKHKPQSFKRRC